MHILQTAPSAHANTKLVMEVRGPAPVGDISEAGVRKLSVSIDNRLPQAQLQSMVDPKLEIRNIDTRRTSGGSVTFEKTRKDPRKESAVIGELK